MDGAGGASGKVTYSVPGAVALGVVAKQYQNSIMQYQSSINCWQLKRVKPDKVLKWFCKGVE